MRRGQLCSTAHLTETKVSEDLVIVIYYPLIVVKINDEIGGLPSI